ncbi:MAG: mechanosensitive ion channel family protein [Formosimonas sp.]
MTQDIISAAERAEHKPLVGSVRELLAHITAWDWLTTALIVLAAWGLTWLVRRILAARTRSSVKLAGLTVNTFSRVLLAFLLWSLAHASQMIYERMGMSMIWVHFLTQLFGALLVVRVFLHMVRRAMPDGSVRQLIERLAVISIWVVMLLKYVGRLDDWIAVLDGFKLTLGKNTVTLADAAALAFVVLVVYLVIKWLAYEIDHALLQRPNKYFTQFDLSSRVVLTRIAKGLLVMFGVLFALTAVGLDLTVLSVFGGALGVGMGLGLQKIASNYVSGFVMLFERSVRIGDLVTTADGYRGHVTQINARYTIIEGVEGNEILVPNEMLVTQPVINWSLHNKNVWLSTSIQVKHDTDVDAIRPQLLAAVRQIQRVLAEPEPCVFLAKITDKGFVLELSWWINDPENGRLNVTSEVNLAIWRVCRAAEVEFFTLQPIEVIEMGK